MTTLEMQTAIVTAIQSSKLPQLVKANATAIASLAVQALNPIELPGAVDTETGETFVLRWVALLCVPASRVKPVYRLGVEP